MICRQASQTENALILRCQGTGCGAVRNTTVCQAVRLPAESLSGRSWHGHSHRM